MKRFKEYLKEEDDKKEYYWNIHSKIFDLNKIKSKTEYMIAHHKRLPSGNHSSVASTERLTGHEFKDKLANKEYPHGTFAVIPMSEYMKELYPELHRKKKKELKEKEEPKISYQAHTDFGFSGKKKVKQRKSPSSGGGNGGSGNGSGGGGGAGGGSNGGGA